MTNRASKNLKSVLTRFSNKYHVNLFDLCFWDDIGFIPMPIILHMIEKEDDPRFNCGWSVKEEDGEIRIYLDDKALYWIDSNLARTETINDFFTIAVPYFQGYLTLDFKFKTRIEAVNSLNMAWVFLNKIACFDDELIVKIEYSQEKVMTDRDGVKWKSFVTTTVETYVYTENGFKRK